MPRPSVAWQASLLDADPSGELVVGGGSRRWLDAVSWVDHVPGWLPEADALFARLVEVMPWEQRTRRMYEGDVLEPRLTASWRSGTHAALPPVLERARATLSDHYRVEFTSVGFNFYRDGRDSVAWHRDKIPRTIREPIVALVSLGAPRRFLLRPRGGGRSQRWQLGAGDLFVTGGRTQRDWEHTVPKVAAAGPRISVAFRHGAA